MKQSTLTRTVPLKRTAIKPSEPKPQAGPRKRKCSICRELFAPRSITHKACSPDCAQALSSNVRQAQERKADRERKQAMKSRQDWHKEAQAALNQWIRLVRDKDLPCISCGRWHDGQWHSGHYLSRGARPNLALIESNIAKQCMPCNVHLSGNQANFRLGLINRIGLQAVESLESDHTPRKYSIEELRAIKEHYQRLVREMKKEK